MAAHPQAHPARVIEQHRTHYVVADGPEASIKAESLPEWQRPRFPSHERPAAGTPTAISKPPPAQSGRRWPALLLLVLLLGVAALLVIARGGPVLAVENQLIEPINLVVDGATYRIAPGEISSVRIRRGRPLAAQWFLVRPQSASGKPMGRIAGRVTPASR